MNSKVTSITKAGKESVAQLHTYITETLRETLESGQFSPFDHFAESNYFNELIGMMTYKVGERRMLAHYRNNKPSHFSFNAEFPTSKETQDFYSQREKITDWAKRTLGVSLEMSISGRIIIFKV
ncbi:MAG TPA: hypothetical protein VG621_01855 [Candidatus Paceibacterota bacterium]|nr:hypothetical protein [Candidatus Paceibacterota bacterium]